MRKHKVEILVTDGIEENVWIEIFDAQSAEEAKNMALTSMFSKVKNIMVLDIDVEIE